MLLKRYNEPPLSWLFLLASILCISFSSPSELSVSEGTEVAGVGKDAAVVEDTDGANLNRHEIGMCRNY